MLSQDINCKKCGHNNLMTREGYILKATINCYGLTYKVNNNFVDTEIVSGIFGFSSRFSYFLPLCYLPLLIGGLYKLSYKLLKLIP